MKKTLLLSAVASTMIMAGGDIAPVEPVVEVATPAPAAVSGWDFSGQGVVYYQTVSDSYDFYKADDLYHGGALQAGHAFNAAKKDTFSQANSAASAGVSLSAVNKDIFGGLGAGVKLIGLGTLGLEKDVVSGVMQSVNGADTLNGGAITELYLTYGVGNTIAKVGRQELPKALSPLAFSESWNVFANTYEAAVLVNSDIPDTTLVGAWVRGANSHTKMQKFDKVNGSDGVFMLTAANKSIEGVGLTGSIYYAPDYVTKDDLIAGWLDAAFDIGDYTAGLQAGIIDHKAFNKETLAFGGKIGGKIDNGMSFGLAATDVNNGGLDTRELGGIDARGVFNVGGGSDILGDNALYTTSPLGSNVLANSSDATTISAKVGMDALGGHFCLLGDWSDTGTDNKLGKGDFYEGALVYNTTVGALDLTAGYVYQNVDTTDFDMDNNIIRAVARYNF